VECADFIIFGAMARHNLKRLRVNPQYAEALAQISMIFSFHDGVILNY
jgi:hypothetical protein